MPAPQKQRLFVALFPPRPVVDLLSEEVGRFRRSLSGDAVRWTPPAQMHLTLNFIGYVDSSTVPNYTDALQACAQRHGKFQVRAVGAGCFPSLRQPRIIWAGLEGDLEKMLALKTDIDQVLMPFGYIPEDRKFHPHLTLGRVNRLDAAERQIVGDWLTSLSEKLYGEWSTERIDLMQSILASTGATYSVVQSFELTGAS